MSTDVSVDNARNRHETRTVEVFRAKPAVAGTEWETLVTDIIRVNRTVLHRSSKTGLWNRTGEVAYYLANFSAPAKRCAAARRPSKRSTRSHASLKAVLPRARAMLRSAKALGPRAKPS